MIGFKLLIIIFKVKVIFVSIILEDLKSATIIQYTIKGRFMSR